MKDEFRLECLERERDGKLLERGMWIENFIEVLGIEKKK